MILFKVIGLGTILLGILCFIARCLGGRAVLFSGAHDSTPAVTETSLFYTIIHRLGQLVRALLWVVAACVSYAPVWVERQVSPVAFVISATSVIVLIFLLMFLVRGFRLGGKLRKPCLINLAFAAYLSVWAGVFYVSQVDQSAVSTNWRWVAHTVTREYEDSMYGTGLILHPIWLPSLFWWKTGPTCRGQLCLRWEENGSLSVTCDEEYDPEYEGWREQLLFWQVFFDVAITYKSAWRELGASCAE